MRILVATASRHGATARIGDVVAQELLANGHEVERRELGDSGRLSPEALSTQGFDAVVLGGAVYTGTWLATALDAQTRLLAAGVPTVSFAVGILEVTAEPVQDRWTLPRTSASAGERVVFGGTIDKQVLSFRERSLLAVVRAKEGEYTQWDDVQAWATAVAQRLVVTA
mgnify:FL=1